MQQTILFHRSAPPITDNWACGRSTGYVAGWAADVEVHACWAAEARESGRGVLTGSRQGEESDGGTCSRAAEAGERRRVAYDVRKTRRKTIVHVQHYNFL